MMILLRALLALTLVLPVAWVLVVVLLLIFGVPFQRLVPEVTIVGEIALMLLLSGSSAVALHQRSAFTG